MPFTKGDPNINLGGRPKGSKNKISEEIKEQFTNILNNKLPEMEQWLERVAETDPAKAMDLAMRLSERFTPMLSRKEITAADGQDLFKNVTFKFGDDINISTPNDSEEFDLDDL